MKARELLESYGSLRQEEVNGRVITILPTCDIPFDHLLEENWRKRWSDEPAKDPHNSYGNYRFVWNVERLANGEEVALYVKHPERVFTKTPANLERGHIWWGGPRSKEGQPLYLRHPSVEEQTLWQAVYLLELYKQGIPAEVPLAIVEWPSGTNELGDSELILHDVEQFPYSERFAIWNLDERLAKIGLLPEDLGGHNIISSKHTRSGKAAIIDVNRWLWPPHTDEWRRELTEYVRTEVQRR
ncbi:MAG TPA: hypothetical protein VJH92_02975 [Candidatus Nanoarchaeia archaeon]|nr:hypothetical protein [Candidatus Nanoarchaeia archaeon]